MLAYTKKEQGCLWPPFAKSGGLAHTVLSLAHTILGLAHTILGLAHTILGLAHTILGPGTHHIRALARSQTRDSRDPSDAGFGTLETLRRGAHKRGTTLSDAGLSEAGPCSQAQDSHTRACRHPRKGGLSISPAATGPALLVLRDPPPSGLSLLATMPAAHSGLLPEPRVPPSQ